MDTHQFQADVRQILHLVTHSIYSDREVFLRELISNASDALEKARHLQATGTDVLSPDTPLEIRITVDEEAGTITIADTLEGVRWYAYEKPHHRQAKTNSSQSSNRMGKSIQAPQV